MAEPSICGVVRVTHSPNWLVYPLEFLLGSKQGMNANEFKTSNFVNDKNHARKKLLLAG